MKTIFLLMASFFAQSFCTAQEQPALSGLAQKYIASASALSGGARLDSIRDCIMAGRAADGIKAVEPKPIDRYKYTYDNSITLCSLTMKIAQQIEKNRSLGAFISDESTKSGDWQGCIEKSRADLKSAFANAIKSIGVESAKAALKEHYILATNAIGAIEPVIGEIVIDYKRRQIGVQAKVSEQWTRFELEQ